MDPIDAIYLDANSLRGGNWAAPNAALTQALELANALNVPIFVPELVLNEAREVFTREMTEHRKKLTDLYADKVASRLQDGSCPELSVADVKKLVELYEQQSQQKLKQYAIATVPLPNISLPDSLAQSAAHTPPFRSDTGFRDSIIAMSCAEHSAKSGFKNAVVISKDGGFPKAEGYLAKSNISVVATAFDLGEKLKQQLNLVLKREFEERQDEVKNALEAQLPQVSEFLSANLEIPEQLEGVLETVVKVERVIAESVKFVTAGYEPIAAEDVHAGAELTTKIVAFTQRNPYTDAWVYGDKRTKTFADLLPTERQIEAPVTLDFTVKRTATGLAFSFTKAELGPLKDALTRLMVRQSMRNAIENPRVGKPFADAKE